MRNPLILLNLCGALGLADPAFAQSASTETPAAKTGTAAYCDDQFARYEHDRPTRERFIDRVNDKHTDSSVLYIQGVFDKMNSYYVRMRKAGCPAAQLDQMNAYADTLMAALKANNQTWDSAQFRRAARRDREEE